MIRIRKASNHFGFYIVTDGDAVLGTFKTAHAAEQYLRTGSHRTLDGHWVAPKDAGFYITIRY